MIQSVKRLLFECIEGRPALQFPTTVAGTLREDRLLKRANERLILTYTGR